MNTRLSRNHQHRDKKAPLKNGLTSLAFVLMIFGAVLVLVFGDENAFTPLSNNLLGVLSLGGGVLLFALAYRLHTKHKPSKKLVCMACGHRWLDSGH